MRAEASGVTVQDEGNELHSFAINRATGALDHINTVPPADPGGFPAPSADACGIATDKTGTFLLTAHYSGGFVSVHSLGVNGAISAEPVQCMTTTTGCHSFKTDRSNKFAFAPCVAAGEPGAGNRIFQFKFHCGLPLGPALSAPPLSPLSVSEITPVDTTNTIADGKNQYGNRGEPGPRHVAFHPNAAVLYSVDEQGNTVTAYELGADGMLTQRQQLPTLPGARKIETNSSLSPRSYLYYLLCIPFCFPVQKPVSVSFSLSLSVCVCMCVCVCISLCLFLAILLSATPLA